MTVSILICAHGDSRWEELAWTRAFPSTLGQAGNPEVLVTHRTDGTLAEIRNESAGRAKGDWLCFLDADDELAPDYVRAMADRMQVWDASNRRPGTETTFATPDEWPLLAPCVQYLHPDGAETDPMIPNRGRWPDLNECVIGTLVSRKRFLAVGGFRDLPSLEDYDLWLRCVKDGAEIVYVTDAVYRAHVNPRGRNADQTTVHELRREHAAVWKKTSATAIRRARAPQGTW